MSSIALYAVDAQVSITVRSIVAQFLLESVNESCYGVVMHGRIEAIMEYLAEWAVLAHSLV